MDSLISCVGESITKSGESTTKEGEDDEETDYPVDIDAYINEQDPPTQEKEEQLNTSINRSTSLRTAQKLPVPLPTRSISFRLPARPSTFPTPDASADTQSLQSQSKLSFLRQRLDNLQRKVSQKSAVSAVQSVTPTIHSTITPTFARELIFKFEQAGLLAVLDETRVGSFMRGATGLFSGGNGKEEEAGGVECLGPRKQKRASVEFEGGRGMCHNASLLGFVSYLLRVR